MKNDSGKVSRRDLLRFSALGAGISVLATAPASLAAALDRRRPRDPRAVFREKTSPNACTGLPTPPQMKGPFYPIHDQLDKDNDLVYVAKSHKRAAGQMVYILGTVTGPDCKPVPGALVEIWQACETGRYNHEHDPNPAPVDPDFQYFGKVVTDKNGRYIFRTIIPGAYPADEQWWRPPHIHFRVLKRGYFELITQMYFAGNSLNAKDKILQSLPPAERASVVVEFTAPPSKKFEPDSKVGVFNIVLKKP